MSGMSDGFGATVEGFTAVSAGERMPVEGRFLCLPWGAVKKAVKFVVGAAPRCAGGAIR